MLVKGDASQRRRGRSRVPAPQVKRVPIDIEYPVAADGMDATFRLGLASIGALPV